MSAGTERVCFISGHMDLTEEEFQRHYVPRLHELIQSKHTFVCGDAPGCDQMAWLWFQDAFPLGGAPLTIYHMLVAPRPCPAWDPEWFPVGEVYPLVGGFTTDEARDAAMTDASHVDLAWVRPGKRGRNSGTQKNLDRRRARERARRRELAASWPRHELTLCYDDDGDGHYLRIGPECPTGTPVDPAVLTRYAEAQDLERRARTLFAEVQEELRRAKYDTDDVID